MEKLIVVKKNCNNPNTQNVALEINTLSNRTREQKKSDDKLLKEKSKKCIPCKRKKTDNSKQKTDFRKESNKIIRPFSIFRYFLLKQKKFLCFFSIVYVLLVIGTFFVFINNKYYDFLYKPVIIKNSNIIIFLIVFSSTLCLLSIFINLFNKKKCLFKKNSKDMNAFGLIKNKKLCKKKLMKRRLNLKLLKTKNAKKVKRIQKNSNDRTSHASIYKLLLTLLLLFGFLLRKIWICVFSAFFICILDVCNIKRGQRTIWLLIFLCDLLTFLSLHIVYLLN